MKIIFFFLAISISIQVSAAHGPHGTEDDEGGIHVGNGGKVLKCAGANSAVYWLLDLYELGNNYNSTDLNKNDSPLNIARQAVKKISELDPARYKRLMKYIESFFSESNFINNSRLGGISDVGLTHIPPSCKLLQAAVQMPLVGTKIRYTIDANIWRNLDPLNKAGLILHEIVYRDFSSGSSHNTSYYVRRFVRELVLKSISNYSLKQYIQLLQSLYVKDYSYHGTKINLRGDSSIIFSDDHQKIFAAPLYSPQVFTIRGKRIKTHSNSRHGFYPNGQIKSVTIVDAPGVDELKRTWSFSTYQTVTLAAALRRVSYTPEGKISSMRLTANVFSKPTIWIGSRYFYLIPNSSITFSEEDNIPSFIAVKTKKGYQIESDRSVRLKGTKYMMCDYNKCSLID